MSAGNSTITNCYNTGKYSASTSTGYYSPLLGWGCNCSFNNCGSLDYGWNPSTTNVTFTGGFVSKSEMKNSASTLGSNFKADTSNVNWRLSTVDLAMIFYSRGNVVNVKNK